MRILFGEDPIEFLPVEAVSTEQVSSEDLPSQVFSRRIPGTSKKREREEAFNPSPSERHHEPETPRRRYEPGPSLGSDSGLPLSTSSPTKSQTQKDQSSSRNGQGRSRLSSEDPGSLFRKLEGATGMKSKQHLTSTAKLQDDGQHRDVSNCGCHRCIHELSITKMEKVTPGQGVSEKLRDLIKSRRIYKSTSLNTHPTSCLCKTHLERGFTQKSSPPQDRKTQRDRSKGVTAASSVSSLRSSFESEATRREDPRTNLPPRPPKPKKEPARGQIPVCTSR